MSRLFYGLLLSISILFLPACSGEPGGETEAQDAPEAGTSQNSNRRIPRVATEAASVQEFREIIQVTGTVDTSNDVRLSARTSGTVEMLAPVGTSVQSGQVVARFDTRLAQAALQQAEAALRAAESRAELARDTFRRQEVIYRDSIISALEFETFRAQMNQAEAALGQAQAAVDQAREQVEYGVITAPFSGAVEERFVETGEQVTPGTPVIRVVNTRSLKVRAGVPERYAADVHVGTPVEIRFQTYDAQARSGTVSFVGNVIHPDNRTFTVEIDLSNPEGNLKPHMIADLLITRRVLTDQIVVPQNAVLRDEEGYSVYVVTPEGNESVVSRRRIETGPTFAGRTVVMSGLEIGDRVVVSGQSTVTEGDAVEMASM